MPNNPGSIEISINDIYKTFTATNNFFPPQNMKSYLQQSVFSTLSYMVANPDYIPEKEVQFILENLSGEGSHSALTAYNILFLYAQRKKDLSIPDNLPRLAKSLFEKSQNFELESSILTVFEEKHKQLKAFENIRSDAPKSLEEQYTRLQKALEEKKNPINFSKFYTQLLSYLELLNLYLELNPQEAKNYFGKIKGLIKASHEYSQVAFPNKHSMPILLKQKSVLHEYIDTLSEFDNIVWLQDETFNAFKSIYAYELGFNEKLCEFQEHVKNKNDSKEYYEKLIRIIGEIFFVCSKINDIVGMSLRHFHNSSSYNLPRQFDLFSSYFSFSLNVSDIVRQTDWDLFLPLLSMVNLKQQNEPYKPKKYSFGSRYGLKETPELLFAGKVSEMEENLFKFSPDSNHRLPEIVRNLMAVEGENEQEREFLRLKYLYEYTTKRLCFSCAKKQAAFIRIMKNILNRMDKNELPHGMSHQERNDLLLKTWKKVIQQFNIFGLDATKELNEALSAGVAGLNRFMSRQVVFSDDEETQLCETYDNLTTLKDKNIFKQIVTLLSFMRDYKGGGINESNIHMQVHDFFRNGIDKSQSLQEILKNLHKTLLKPIFPKDAHLLENDKFIKSILQSIDKSHLPLLINGSSHMKENYYGEIYFEIIRLLLVDPTGKSLKDFLHNTEQDNPLGKAIAEHNKRIQEKLRAAGIYNKKDNTSATEYKETLRFTIGDVQVENTRKVLEDIFNRLQTAEGVKFKEALIALREELNKNSEENKKALTQLRKIENMLKKFQGLKYSKILVLKSLEALLKEIKVFDKTLKGKLSSQQTLVPFIQSYQEFKEHFTDLTEKYQTESKKSPQENNQETTPKEFHRFTVKQYEKCQLDTLFLGNNVSCCLAMGSTQFHAIIQRILDDAMLFHVVVDEKTQEPVALTWLYFAEKEDGSITLVANFFEINKNYTQSPNVKEGILKGLLQFTDKFCKDNNIPDFYLNTLTYGAFIGSLECHGYDQKPLKLKDKLGGAFIPGMMKENINPDMTHKYYYLNSLAQSKAQDGWSFHEFSREKLDKFSVQGFEVVKEENAPEMGNNIGKVPQPLVESLMQNYIFTKPSACRPKDVSHIIPASYKGLRVF